VSEPHLWDASETVPQEHWWDLLDHAPHVLVAGALKDAKGKSALTRAADSGELLANDAVPTQAAGGRGSACRTGYRQNGR